MTAIDWFWVGRNNAVDRQICGIEFDVGMFRVASYWLGYVYGRALRLVGVRR